MLKVKWSWIVIESILEGFTCRFAIAGAIQSGLSKAAEMSISSFPTLHADLFTTLPI